MKLMVKVFIWVLWSANVKSFQLLNSVSLFCRGLMALPHVFLTFAHLSRNFIADLFDLKADLDFLNRLFFFPGSSEVGIFKKGWWLTPRDNRNSKYPCIGCDIYLFFIEKGGVVFFWFVIPTWGNVVCCCQMKRFVLRHQHWGLSFIISGAFPFASTFKKKKKKSPASSKPWQVWISDGSAGADNLCYWTPLKSYTELKSLHVHSHMHSRE